MRTKEQIHTDLLNRLKAGVSLAQISRAAGVPYSSLRQFKDDTSLGLDYLKGLDTWLLVADHKKLRSRQYDAGQEIGILLRNLSDFMLSENFSLNDRVAYLQDNIQAVVKLIPSLEAIAKEEENHRD